MIRSVRPTACGSALNRSRQKRIGEEHARLVPDGAFLVQEQTALRRTHAHQTEERRRGDDAADDGRDAANLHGPAREVVERLLFEGADVLEAVGVVRRGAEYAASRLDLRVEVRHEQHALGFGCVQRMEEDRVDASQDRGMAAKADGEGQDGGQRESAVFPECTESQSQLPPPAFERQEIEQRERAAGGRVPVLGRQIVRERRPGRHLGDRGVPRILFARAALDERRVPCLELGGELLDDVLVSPVRHVGPREMATNVGGEITHIRVRRRAAPRP